MLPWEYLGLAVYPYILEPRLATVLLTVLDRRRILIAIISQSCTKLHVLSKMSTITETEFLIVGAGPAGAGLASFLGQNGNCESSSLVSSF